ncbi:MAG: response regulator [Parashewanella sp.]
MALTDISILLIEVDTNVNKQLTSFLSKQGAMVSVAQEQSAVSSLLETYRFDLAIIDLTSNQPNGLDALKTISQESTDTHSLVLSDNNVMSDVIEALRLGASDYLVLPIEDMYVLEHTIHQCLGGTVGSDADLTDELAYLEFDSHVEALEKNYDAASHIQQQLFPAAKIHYPRAEVSYSLFKHSDMSNYVVDSVLVGEHHLSIYMAHFQPTLPHNLALASVMLRGLIDQKLKLFRQGKSQAIIEPFNMLSYLNDRVSKSGLDIYIDMVYLTVNLNSYRTAIAQAGQGLRCYLRNHDGLMPLALADSLQLGMNTWGKSSTQYRTLTRSEYLCISSSNPEHKPLLLSNQFVGLVKSSDYPIGGYVELRL